MRRACSGLSYAILLLLIAVVESGFDAHIKPRCALRELLVLNETALLPTPELKPVEAPTVDRSSLYNALEQDNPELRMLRKRIESAEARKALARMEMQSCRLI